MEPVTHILTGACLARTGFNRRVAYATAAMAIGAEFPDIDTLWSLHDPITGFEHHRGLTHSFLGLPVEAALLLLGFTFYHRWRTRKGARPVDTPHAPPRGVPLFAAERRQAAPPVRWAALYGLLLLALGSHLLLDYTNNYGIRPFFPFHDAWYAASLVFIFDPLLFTLLLAGLLLPALFGLIGREVGARRERFPGRGWARAALAGVVLLWALRWFEHQNALSLAQNQTLRAPAQETAPPAVEVFDDPGTGANRPLLVAQRSLANPDPLNPFRWYTATDFGPAYRLGLADTHRSTFDPGAIFTKSTPQTTLVTAERTHLGRVYLDWSTMPLVRLSAGLSPGISPVQSDETSNSAAHPDQIVTFTDLRFYGDLPFLNRSRQPPLTGEILLDRNGRVLAEGMDGRFAP